MCNCVHEVDQKRAWEDIIVIVGISRDFHTRHDIALASLNFLSLNMTTDVETDFQRNEIKADVQKCCAVSALMTQDLRHIYWWDIILPKGWLTKK